MKGCTILLVCFILLLGCSSSKPIHYWKANTPLPRTYNKILVVGIIKDTNTNLRSRVESFYVDALKKLGYNVVSALQQYGAKGLADLGQEETYTKLCNSGVDGIFTIALLNSATKFKTAPAKVRYYSNVYYYNRIWSYHNNQADLNLAKNGENNFYWESILFDLNTLEPIYTVQTKLFPSFEAESSAQEFANIIFANMIKNKVVVRQEKPLRPF